MTSWKNDTKIPDLHTITSAYHAEINMDFEKKKKKKKGQPDYKNKKGFNKKRVSNKEQRKFTNSFRV
jgi:phosphatidylinositol kinase/protein kinase (PI-3  family)